MITSSFLICYIRRNKFDLLVCRQHKKYSRLVGKIFFLIYRVSIAERKIFLTEETIINVSVQSVYSICNKIKKSSWKIFRNWVFRLFIVWIFFRSRMKYDKKFSLFLSDILHITIWFFLFPNKCKNMKRMNEK